MPDESKISIRPNKEVENIEQYRLIVKDLFNAKTVLLDTNTTD